MKRMKPHTTALYAINPDDFSVLGPLSHHVDTRNGKTRKRWWTKARIPGGMRKSRMPGGSGYRGDKHWEFPVLPELTAA